MTLSITDTLITSDITQHTAQIRKPAVLVTWEVSWFWNSVGLTKDQAVAAMELAEIVARGRDDKETTNYAYLTWQRVKELAEVLGVIPLKTVLYLEGLGRSAAGSERSDPERK